MDIRATRDEIIARLVDGGTISLPLAWSRRLSESTLEQQNNFEIIGDGQGVHQPDADVDMSVEGMPFGSPARRPERSSGSQKEVRIISIALWRESIARFRFGVKERRISENARDIPSQGFTVAVFRRSNAFEPCNNL